MKRILQVNSSARGTASVSSRLASELVARLRAADPALSLVVRDLGREPLPELDEAALGALFTPPAERTQQQAARVAHDDALIAELQAADTVVLGVPMINFGIPAQLKNWIDAISRARVTFRYTEHGAEGLLTGKKVYVVLARGGTYRDSASDSQVPYLRMVLGFLGMTDIEFVYAEGLALGPAAESAALAGARARIAELV